MTTDTVVPEDLKVYGVTVSGKIYWAKRNARGQFCNAYGRNRADGVETAYAAYVESRVSLAERETRGNMLSPAGRRRGISVIDVLTGRRSLRWGTAELRDWLRTQGQILRFQEFRTLSAY